MKRKRHTEEQIIAILKEHEAGMKTADLCRRHGISEASFYNWKAKYGGLETDKKPADTVLEALEGIPVGTPVRASGMRLRMPSVAAYLGSRADSTLSWYRREMPLRIPSGWRRLIPFVY